GIACQGMHKLGVCFSKKSFDNGTISWLCPGSTCLGAGVVGQQRLKVDAAKIGTSIDNQRLRKAPIAPHALPECHHTRSVTGRIKCQVHHEQPAREGIRHEGGPGSAKWTTRASAHEFNI